MQADDAADGVERGDDIPLRVRENTGDGRDVIASLLGDACGCNLLERTILGDEGVLDLSEPWRGKRGSDLIAKKRGSFVELAGGEIVDERARQGREIRRSALRLRLRGSGRDERSSSQDDPNQQMGDFHDLAESELLDFRHGRAEKRRSMMRDKMP
jgi:hypothetical protein